MKPLKGKALPIQTISFSTSQSNPNNVLPLIQTQPAGRQNSRPHQNSLDNFDSQPQQSFSDFMKQKMMDPEIKKAYDDANKPIAPQTMKQISKPFQIKSSQTANSFTSNSSNSKSSKKPFNQFYQSGKMRTINDQLQRPQQKLQEESYISTEKSEDITNDFETKSVKSETFSISKSSQETNKNKSFVEKKKDQINYDQWKKNEPKQIKLQTKEYQDILNQANDMIKQRDQTRQKQIEELEGFLQSKQNVQREIKQQLNEELELDKQIQQLQVQLDDVENEELEQKVKADLNKFRKIIEEPIENDSQISSMTLKQRSMFITELLKNREKIIAKITGQTQDDDEQSQQLEIEQIEKNVEEQQNRFYEIVQTELPKEYQIRLDQLLFEIDNPKSNQLQNNPFIIPKDKLKECHQKIKKYNPKFNENADLELDKPGILPKDPILRKEAIDRILEIKQQEISDAIMKLASKGNQLEEKQKILGMIEIVKKSTQYFPSDFLKQKLQQFEILESQNNQCQKELQQIDANKLLNEFNQYKYQLDDVLKKNQSLFLETNSNILSLHLNQIHEYQDRINHIEKEYQEVCQTIQKFDEIKLLPEIPELNEQDDNLQEKESQEIIQQEKTIADYDQEITNQLKIQHPELFED